MFYNTTYCRLCLAERSANLALQNTIFVLYYFTAYGKISGPLPCFYIAPKRIANCSPLYAVSFLWCHWLRIVWVTAGIFLFFLLIDLYLWVLGLRMQLLDIILVHSLQLYISMHFSLFLITLHFFNTENVVNEFYLCWHCIL